MNWITLPLLCAALWLTGCASTRLVDSDVQSFSQLAGAPARATYSFERLPSQQAQGAQQSAVEDQARLALAKVGLRQDSAAPFYRVHVHARTERTSSRTCSHWEISTGLWAGLPIPGNAGSSRSIGTKYPDFGRGEASPLSSSNLYACCTVLKLTPCSALSARTDGRRSPGR